MKKFFFIVILLVAVCPVSNANDFMSKALNSWMGYSINDLISMGIISESDSKDKDGNVIDICIGYNINNELDIVSCTPCS